MRKLLIGGSAVLILLVGGIAWILSHPGDPLANARKSIAHQNMRGAEFYLRQALRVHPDNAEVAFLLGRVDLALGNPQAAELELRRARDRGYSQSALTIPLGQAYLQQQHFDAALRDFDPTGAQAVDRGDILTIRAAAQLALGDATAAATTIALAQAATPDSRETLLTASRIALARDDPGSAASLVDRILVREPGQPDALLLQGEIAMRRSDPKTALAKARLALASNPGRLDARMVEARALAALGKPDEARGSVSQVLRGSPKNVSANFLSAMLEIQAGDYEGADAALTRIGPVVDRLPRGLYFLAVTKLGIGQPAQAEEAASKFLAKMPDDIAGLKLLAFIDLARRQAAPALHLLQSGALASHQDADTLDLTGRAQALLGDLNAATSSFAQASQRAPKDTAILNRLAAAHLDLGDAKAAEDDLRRSLRIAPKQHLAGEAIVQASLARGDTAVATQEVEQLRSSLGDTEEVGVLAAQVKLASLDFKGAQAQLQDVRHRFPDSRAAILGLARINGLLGEPEAARTLLQDQLHRHPDDGSALDALLPILFASKQDDLAVRVAEAAHTAAPDNPGITADLAGTYVRTRQADRAVALLDRASAEANPALDALRARILSSGGKTEQAERAFRAILRQSPSNLRIRTELAYLAGTNQEIRRCSRRSARRLGAGTRERVAAWRPGRHRSENRRHQTGAGYDCRLARGQEQSARRQCSGWGCLAGGG